MENKKITICACTSRSFIDKNKVVQLATRFRESGYDVSIIADLCELVMIHSPELEEIAHTNILACYPRAVRSQMDWHNLRAENVYDIRNNSKEEILSQFGITSSETNGKEVDPNIFNQVNGLPVAIGSDAWYPVLDKTKCTNCGKCHDFCLFGVYTIENEEVKVVQPQNCKNNCPACARICPGKAIIFPKYAKSPINGGTTEEEQFDPQMQDSLYQERLRYRLQQRREGVALRKKNHS
jgi:NAD-dependent dihydropyrimidine dehydrogenase PreA subunit